MKTDIEIARAAKIKPIRKIAKWIGIKEKELELYGDNKAKLKPELWEKLKNKKDGKLILVTAMSPTPLGEGKTTTSIGLAMAMNSLGKKTILALREPSLGPCMGVKGGAAGGGYSQVVPMDEINLHFTGDLHAITTANNLLAALIDNHIYHGNALGIDPEKILWKRALDLNDRALRKVTVDLSRKGIARSREDNFNITVASEIMAILCLSDDLEDLRKKLGRIVVAYDISDKPVFAKDLKAVGALAAILKDAIKPNFVQTLEQTPALVHGGPFANIAHGCNSLIATKYALKLADYTVTEAGFGADLGAEKFFDIKCRLGRLKPDAVVIVATIRSLKYNGGMELDKVEKRNGTKAALQALQNGLSNLEKHLENLNKFNLPIVVAINVFPNDTDEEIDLIFDKCEELGVECALSEVWERGGKGGKDLAKKVLRAIKKEKADFKVLYSVQKSIPVKIETIARKIYGADGVEYSEKALAQIAKLENDQIDKLPICIAKTQYSLSDDPKLLGRPEGFKINIKELRISNGAGFIVAIAGDIMTMPGLPKIPAAEKIDVDRDGKITGLF